MIIIRIILIIILLTINNQLFANIECVTQDNSNIKEKWQETLKKYPRLDNAISLIRTGKFPLNNDEQKGEYLWDAESMSPIINGEFAVPDKKAGRMFIFNKDGKILNIVGRRGQAPGEFQNPYCLYKNDKYIVVSDTFNMNMIFYSPSGEYIKSIKMFRAYYDIAINKEGLIYAAPMRMEKGMLLVDVLDENGIVLYSFGEAMYGNDMDWQIPNFVMIDINEENDVFVAYKYFPLICQYSSKGELKKKIKIENAIMKKGEEYNLNRKKRSGISIVIYGIQAKKNGFYLLNINPRTEILEYDYQGAIKNYYYYEESYDTRYSDFKVIEENGEKVFYLLKKNPENEINVFRPKIQNHKERS